MYIYCSNYSYRVTNGKCWQMLTLIRQKHLTWVSLSLYITRFIGFRVYTEIYWQDINNKMIYFSLFLVKNIGTSKNMLFRVFSHSVDGYSISEQMEYHLPEDLKTRAVTAGLIGGILFFIVAIILSVCTVKICNKARRRKQERGNFKHIWNIA